MHLRLPLIFKIEETNPDIPGDPASCCTDAHKFPAEVYLTEEVLEKIEVSLRGGEVGDLVLVSSCADMNASLATMASQMYF